MSKSNSADSDVTPLGDVQGVAVGELKIPTVDLSFHFGNGAVKG